MKVKRLKNRFLAIESFRTGTKWILESDHLGVADVGARRRAGGREASRGYRTREETKREVEKGKG